MNENHLDAIKTGYDSSIYRITFHMNDDTRYNRFNRAYKYISSYFFSFFCHSTQHESIQRRFYRKCFFEVRTLYIDFMYICVVPFFYPCWMQFNLRRIFKYVPLSFSTDTLRQYFLPFFLELRKKQEEYFHCHFSSVKCIWECWAEWTVACVCVKKKRNKS